MYVRGYLQGSENGRVVTIDLQGSQNGRVVTIAVCSDHLCLNISPACLHRKFNIYANTF